MGISSDFLAGSLSRVAESMNSHLLIFSNVLVGIGGIPSATTVEDVFPFPPARPAESISFPKVDRSGSFKRFSVFREASTGKDVPSADDPVNDKPMTRR